MPILDQILQELDDFERNYSVAADVIYLGYEEFAMFRREVQAFMTYPCPPHDQPPEYIGFPVYEVKTKNHLRVA